jgi:hypothetical protein
VPIQIVTGQLSLLINSGKEVPPVWRVYGSLWRALLLDAGVVARHRTRACALFFCHVGVWRLQNSNICFAFFSHHPSAPCLPKQTKQHNQTTPHRQK